MKKFISKCVNFNKTYLCVACGFFSQKMLGLLYNIQLKKNESVENLKN